MLWCLSPSKQLDHLVASWRGRGARKGEGSKLFVSQLSEGTLSSQNYLKYTGKSFEGARRCLWLVFSL